MDVSGYVIELLGDGFEGFVGLLLDLVDFIRDATRCQKVYRKRDQDGERYPDILIQERRERSYEDDERRHQALPDEVVQDAVEGDRSALDAPDDLSAGRSMMKKGMELEVFFECFAAQLVFGFRDHLE